MVLRIENHTSDAHLDGPRALRPEEHPAAIELLNSTLRPNGPPTILKEYPLVLGEDNIENMRVIVKGKEVVSHAAIYFSSLISGKLVFKVGGVGSVATHPAHRGQGLASAVVNDCIRVMEEAGCHLSVLWTQRHGFYRNLGYERAGSEYLFRVKASNLRHVSCDCEVIPYSPSRLPAIMEIHERETIRAQRTEREWQTYFGIPKSNALLSVRDGRVTAYAVMGKGEDFRRCILDWGGNAQDLLCLAREFASADGGEVLILVPAQEHEFTRLLEHMRLPKIFEYLAMIRIIGVDGLSSLIREHVVSRLGADFRILTSETGLKIIAGKEETPVEPELALPRILFGPDTASSLLPELSRPMAAALDRALPVPLFIWGLDSV